LDLFGCVRPSLVRLDEAAVTDHSKTWRGSGMSSENPVADRLLNDARKKAARAENPVLTLAALITGIVGVLAAYWVPLVGWILGVVAVGLAVPGVRVPDAGNRPKIAMTIGAASILVGVYSFCLAIA
jgi:hypothetical protein